MATFPFSRPRPRSAGDSAGVLGSRRFSRKVGRFGGWFLAVVVSFSVCAQFRRGSGGANSPRQTDPNMPAEYFWEINPRFHEDVFTFARLEYERHSRGRGGYWDTDSPDADYNIALRLHQMTSLSVRPGFNHISITEQNLANYPFVYMIEPGRLGLTEDEVVALRRYFLNGGFMMVDDFWGNREWDNFAAEMRRVFSDLEWVELEADHPIFHSVFDLKEKPQMPAIENYIYRGMTFEPRYSNGGMDPSEPHYRALLDPKGRIMVIACHNTDLGDGWEREGEDERYFRKFSEAMAYPMAINIFFYAMTH